MRALIPVAAASVVAGVVTGSLLLLLVVVRVPEPIRQADIRSREAARVLPAGGGAG